MRSSCRRRSRLEIVYARLARRLTRVALAGYLAVALVVVGGLGLAIWALQAGWYAEQATWRTLYGLGAALTIAAVGYLLVLVQVPAPQPRGIPLARSVAGALHYRIDKLAQRLGLPPPDGVWITDEMNAAVLQRPRWGCVGRIDSHLMIGLPLAHCLSRRQFLAVLAHEFGHLVVQRQAAGGAFGAHLRAWWLRLADRIAVRHAWLESWLDRRWRGYTLGMLRLARLEEFAADALAARLVGRRLLGETLVEMSAKDRFLREDYWPKVLAQCSTAPEPRFRPFREMGLGVSAGFNAHSVVNVGFGEGEDGPVSLHPSPAQRLRALRVPTSAAVPPKRSAATHYLSDLLPRLSWAFDRHWWRLAGRYWRRSYCLAHRERQRAARRG